MHVGRQEDAHEYMRFFVEALQKSCLSDAQGYCSKQSQFPDIFCFVLFFKKRLDNRSKETTFVYGTFAGYLRSQVQCLSCKFRSNTFDAFLDLSLDILHADSIAKALNGFTKPERLEGDNQYHCSRFFFLSSRPPQNYPSLQVSYKGQCDQAVHDPPSPQCPQSPAQAL